MSERRPIDRRDDSTETLAASITTTYAASGMVASAGASGVPDIGLTTVEGIPTIPVASVLTNLVEGYLFGDLESMATEVPLKEVGACGYPMVMAVLTGCELLAAITSDAAQDDRIETYWKTYMAEVDPLYGYLGQIASQLARNGIAHTYLAHLGVLVVRGNPRRHLTLSENEEVVLDCLELYSQFRQSYEDHARPFILENINDVQRRVDELVRYDRVKAKSLIGALPFDRFRQTLPSGNELATPLHVRPPTGAKGA
jgi:hypothetical protein